MKRSHSRDSRCGAVAVEAAACLIVLVIMLLGLWEVGRLIHVNQVLNNAAREGARLAAGGYVNSVPVTAAQVKQAVRDYMTAAGLPSTAVSGSTVNLTCQASPSWTDPSAALPLDKFAVSITIPSGAAFNSLKWTLLSAIAGPTSISVTVNWQSLNNTVITVPTALPF
jgi:Flp pilus assembly protein TadG